MLGQPKVLMAVTCVWDDLQLSRDELSWVVLGWVGLYWVELKERAIAAKKNFETRIMEYYESYIFVLNVP